MKNFFNTLVSIFFTLTIISLYENSVYEISLTSESHVKEIYFIVFEVENLLILRIVQPLVPIASSYTTNLIPDTEQISINQITISNKLDCNSENTNLCDELYCFLAFRFIIL